MAKEHIKSMVMRPPSEANLQSACKNSLPSINSENSLPSCQKSFSNFSFLTNSVECFKTPEYNNNSDSFLPPIARLRK